MKKKKISEKTEFPMVLSKFLSSAGVASRRKCVTIIKNKDVTVNGTIIDHPGYRVTTEDTVQYLKSDIKIDKKHYIILNKPRGYICTNNDPFATKKAIDLIDIPNIRLFSVGRLDKESEGMIIFTNDGLYAEKLMHPKHGIRKVYLVTTDNQLTTDDLAKVRKGITHRGDFLKPETVAVKSKLQYIFVMKEGKKREIRRIVKATGKTISRLQRTAIGTLSINDLQVGTWRHLNRTEVALTLKE